MLQARPDETVAIGGASRALTGDFNPHFFHWPSLTFYLFAAVFGIVSLVRRGIGLAGELPPADLILIGRITVATAGTATVFVLYRIGRRVAGPPTGLVAAAFLAVALLHVRDSHFAMTDVLMTCFITASLALLLRALDVALAAPAASALPLRGFAAAGLVAGLATSTKYSAAAMLAAMGSAQIVLWAVRRGRPWDVRTWTPSAIFAAALVGGFLATTPYAVLDYPTFARDLTFDFTHLAAGHGVNLGRGWSYHLTRSLPYGTGVLTFAAALPGFAFLIRSSPRHGIVITLLAGAFYVSIGSGYTVFFRYVLPLVPIVCLAAAVMAVHLARALAPRLGLGLPVATTIVAGLIAAPSLVNSIWFSVLLGRTDTRVLAAQWLAPRVKAGETLYDSGGDYSVLDLGRTPYHVWHYDARTNRFENAGDRVPDWLVLHRSPLHHYGTHSPLLRQTAEARYDLVWEIRATGSGGSGAVYDHQDAFFLPFSRFNTVIRPGPSILIYRLRDAGAGAIGR